MVPKLYLVIGSPPVRAVLMCAKALGLELELVNLNLLEKEQLKDDYLKIPLIYKNIQPDQDKLDGLREAYQFLEQILANNKTSYVAGDLSIADFSITSSMTSFNLFVPYTDFPNITAYIKRIEKLPFYEENKAGLTMFNTIFGSILKI